MGDFKDSGERRTFESGAQRDRAYGKGKFVQLPPFALFLVARIFEDGARKYSARNWERGMPVGEFVDSAVRHLEKYQAGLRDEPHLSMAGWNILCAIWTAAMVTLGLLPRELFDLPNHVGSGPAEPLSPYEQESLAAFIGRPACAPTADSAGQGRPHDDSSGGVA